MQHSKCVDVQCNIIPSQTIYKIYMLISLYTHTHTDTHIMYHILNQDGCIGRFKSGHLYQTFESRPVTGYLSSKFVVAALLNMICISLQICSICSSSLSPRFWEVTSPGIATTFSEMKE